MDASTLQSHHRHPHVQSLTCRGGSSIRRRIQSHINEAVHVQVTSRLRLQSCQIQASSCDAMHCKSSPHLLLDFGTCESLRFDEESGIRHLMQDFAPESDGQRAHLGQVVEAAEGHAAVALLSRLQEHRRRRLRRCVTQEALRQVEELLCGQAGRVLRVGVLIGDSVVHPRQPSRVRVAQPCDADRSRFAGKHTKPVVAGVASQVYENVDAIFPDELGDLFISATANVPPSRNEAAEVAGFIILQDDVTVAYNVDKGRIMVLERCVDKVRNGVRVEVGRDVAHT
mmetsp:Transcript_50122/g.119753  ORF Transcript_50122/g.119753 Transcript_50122/m.119753 type:complete len:284 (-) Transcript_50122:295-1146(-)